MDVPDVETNNDLRTLRLRLVIDQANRYAAGELGLAELAAGIDALISALRDENGDSESAAVLQPIWGGIEIVNALCLDERREPRPAEEAELRRDLARIRQAAEARLALPA